MRDEFMKDIAADPDDNGLRLIYADWLEDSGDFARAKLIRSQMSFSGNPEEQDVLLLDNWIRWLEHLPSVGWHCGNIDSKLDQHVAPAVWFRRGMISRIRCNQKLWLDYGPAIIVHHPILYVELTDLTPTLFEFDELYMIERECSDLEWGEHGPPTCSDERDRLAGPIFDKLSQGDPYALNIFFNKYVSRVYEFDPEDPRSPDEALETARIDASNACIEYAKEVAGEKDS